MSSLLYTCSGRTCPAGSLSLGRIPHVGNGQDDEGGKVVTSKARLLPCSPPDRPSGTAETEGWGTEIQEADVPSSPTRIEAPHFSGPPEKTPSEMPTFSERVSGHYPQGQAGNQKRTC